MKISINNKTGIDRVITILDNGTVKKYAVQNEEIIDIECNEDLAELECSGTLHLCPTIFDYKAYVLIEDQEITQARKQLDIIYIITLVILCAVSILLLKVGPILIGLFLVIIVLLVTGMYKILKTEQKGEVVFIER